MHWSRMSHSHQSALEHLRTYGWSASPAGFRAEDAAAMCDLIWAALREVGIHRNDPSNRTTVRAGAHETSEVRFRFSLYRERAYNTGDR